MNLRHLAAVLLVLVVPVFALDGNPRMHDPSTVVLHDGWVNGKEVIGIYNDRQTVIDDGVSRRLILHKGPNILRAAVVNGGGATDFCGRFLDAEYRPLKDITVTVADR